MGNDATANLLWLIYTGQSISLFHYILISLVSHLVLSNSAGCTFSEDAINVSKETGVLEALKGDGPHML